MTRAIDRVAYDICRRRRASGCSPNNILAGSSSSYNISRIRIVVITGYTINAVGCCKCQQIHLIRSRFSKKVTFQYFVDISLLNKKIVRSSFYSQQDSYCSIASMKQQKLFFSSFRVAFERGYVTLTISSNRQTREHRLQRLVWNKWQYDTVVTARHWPLLLVTVHYSSCSLTGKMCCYTTVRNVSLRTDGARV